jgi:hypothetical protein
MSLYGYQLGKSRIKMGKQRSCGSYLGSNNRKKVHDEPDGQRRG